ncbi:aspartic peptidase domain-containing protein [Xylariaceae sp. FL1651]|nr:aspartic peptidase domain-containing protein [Xylariaceae sp. FL1651]
MHRVLTLIQLSLWITSICALVPAAPESQYEAERRDVDTASRGFITFTLVKQATPSRKLAADSAPRSPVGTGYKVTARKPTRTEGHVAFAARDNQYRVDKAQDPTVSNSAGIDQDGTDYSYFAEVKFGSGSKSLYMLLDTGASTTWVMGSSCTSNACTKHNTFGPDDSKTYNDTGKSYSVEYGTGSVRGTIVEDAMTLAGISVTIPFGVANTTSDQFTQFPFDGILGLSASPDTWLSAVKNANLVDSNLFGVSLSRSSDGTNAGEIVFGAPNPAKFTGDITYTPVKSIGAWTIPVDDVMVGGKSAGITGRTAYIDTGTSFVFGPPDDVEAMYKLIPGSSSTDGSTYSVPCDSDAEVAFTFSGKSWAVSSKDFLSAPNGDGVCIGNIYGMEYVAGGWLLGDVFLKNVYSIFDAGNSQIGFAAKAVSDTSTSSSTTTPTGTSTTVSSPSGTSSSATETGPPMGLNGHETPSGTDAPAGQPTDSSSSAPASSGSRLAAGCYNSHSNAAPPKNEEEHGLLAGHESDGEDGDEEEEDGLIVHPGSDDDEHGSLGPRTPRTPNRVRFDLRPTNIPPAANGAHSPAPLRDYFDVHEPDSPGGRDRTSRRPLLTDIEAPSVTVANSLGLGDDGDIHTWAERERTRPKSGLRSAFMNMANSIIGAGIIGQPYAFKDAGLAAGIVLLVSLTVVIDWTIRLIVINSKLSGASSFQGTVEHCFGKTGLIAISVAQWAFAFGGMVAFGVIVGDSIPPVFRAIWPNLHEIPVLSLLGDRRAVIVIFILGISYPLTLYRDIAKLAKASTLALISMSIIISTVVIQGALTPLEDRGSFTTPLLTVNVGIFQAIGVISFAFVCQHNSLLIYGSLKTPTIDRFSTVTHYSTGVSMLACLVMALAGFLTFGDKTLGNVLNNFPADNTMVTIARLCFGLNMLTTLPLEAFVCREVMLNYWFPNEPFNMNLHLIYSSALVVSAMALSLFTCDLGVVFELVGATSACALAYILPPLCYIKLSSRSWKTYVAMGVVAFGCAVMLISVLQAGAKMIKGEGEPAKCV